MAAVWDGHAHIFPPRVFAALRRWFDAHAWPCLYPADSEAVDAAMEELGVERYVGLLYSHVEGMAEVLNAYARDFSERHPRCIRCATVLPGEPGAERILGEALDDGARIVKLHCHVQRFAPDEARLIPLQRLIADRGATLLIHCGDAPQLSGYACDIAALCQAPRFRRFLERSPELKVIVPHLGASEVEAYVDLLGDFPNLHLDTAMALSGELALPEGLFEEYSERIIFGTDFPNIPHRWDHERGILEAAAPQASRAALFKGNLARLLGEDA